MLPAVKLWTWNEHDGISQPTFMWCSNLVRFCFISFKTKKSCADTSFRIFYIEEGTLIEWGPTNILMTKYDFWVVDIYAEHFIIHLETPFYCWFSKIMFFRFCFLFRFLLVGILVNQTVALQAITQNKMHLHVEHQF